MFLEILKENRLPCPVVIALKFRRGINLAVSYLRYRSCFDECLAPASSAVAVLPYFNRNSIAFRA